MAASLTCEEKLRALLEGLECENIERFMKEGSSEMFREVGMEITKAAKLGANLYGSKPTGSRQDH